MLPLLVVGERKDISLLEQITMLLVKPLMEPTSLLLTDSLVFLSNGLIFSTSINAVTVHQLITSQLLLPN